ncbi:MAG: hypothetical protein EB084_22915, partial [Proteobacteria bacterium]|nr:hypothetical protein [Pseudomonadota bacterium]
LSDANAAPIVMGQNGPAKMLQGEVHLTQGVAGAFVTVYESDGTIAGTATTDANGTFTVFEPLFGASAVPAAKTAAAKATAGLAPGERRYVAVVPSDAPEGAGTVLTADTPAPFAHISPLETEMSLLREAEPGLSLTGAAQAVKAANDIPVDYDVDDAGGDVSPLSDGQLEADAQAYNTQNGHAGSPSLNDFLASEAGRARAYVAAARNKTAAPAAQAHRKQTKTAAAATGADPNRVNGVNADNTDPKGSLDPDRQQALDSWGAGSFTPTPSFTAEQLQEGTYSLFGTISGIFSTAVDGFTTITGLLATIDAANGNTVEKSTKVLSYIAGGLVIASVISQVVLNILQANADDPYLKGLQQLSQQIEQGFNQLSQQIRQSTAFLRWSNSQQTLQQSTSQMQGRLSTLATVSAPQAAGLQPYDTVQQNVQSSTSNTQGATLESTFINQSLGLNGANAVTDGIAAYTSQSTYQPSASTGAKANAKAADGLGYNLRDNATTLTLRGLEMQYANAIGFAARVDAYESKAAYATFGTGFSRIKALSDRVASGSEAVASLRRRGLQQAPPRFSSDKIRVDASRGIAWYSTYVQPITFGPLHYTKSERTDYGQTTYTYTIAGNVFSRDFVRLDTMMYRNWRLPKLSELQALPGWGTPECLNKVKSEMGIDLNGRHYVAAFDPTAPDPISDHLPYGSSSSYVKVTRQVRFYDVTTGGEVKPGPSIAGRFWDGTIINCIAVLDLNNLSTAIERPDEIGSRKPAIDDARFAGPLDARVYSLDSAALNSQNRAIESSVLRAAGIPPSYIKVVDHVIDNPWYSANPILPQQQARKIHALSAVGVWAQNNSDVIVDDLSGVVEWQVDDASVARVTNTFSEWPSVSERAKAAGLFVSPWFSTLVFSKAGTVKVTANWMQGITSTTASNTTTIPAENSADLAIPPVLSALNVYPTGMVITNAAQLQGKVMSAYGEMSDNTAADYNTKVQWSLLEV